MRLIVLSLSLVYFTLFYINLNDFFFAVYSFTNISTFVPFWLVITVLWFFLLAGGLGLLAALKDVRRGVEWTIIFMPMSALPFIFLGVPLAALNTIFICRSMLNFFVYLLSLKWLVGVSLLGKPALRLPLFWATSLMVTSYLFNIIFVEPEIRANVFKSGIILVSCIMFFYLMINIVRDEKSLIRILEIMVVACIVQVLMSSLSFFYYIIIKGRALFRVEGMLRDYELFAEYLALHIPLFIYLMRNPGTLINRNILRAFLPLTIFVLLATATRGPILSLGLGLIYYAWKIRGRVRLPQIALQVLMWSLVVSVVVVVLYKALPSSAQILERFAATKVATLDTRDFVWHKFWQYFLDKPIVGHGIVYSLGSYLFFPHSTYFYYLLTMGIPGCLAYLILLTSVLWKGFRSERLAPPEGKLFEIAVVLNAILITFIVDSIKIEYLRYPNYQLFVWLLFSLIVIVHGLLVKKKAMA
jgi:O-antigen ligase